MATPSLARMRASQISTLTIAHARRSSNLAAPLRSLPNHNLQSPLTRIPSRRHPSRTPYNASSSHLRAFHATPTAPSPAAPKTRDRGPPSKEDTQTDFSAMNILSAMPVPTTAIDACMDDGFALDSGMKVTGGSGVLLIGGEAFKWQPWTATATTAADSSSSSATPANGTLVNSKGQWEVDTRVWGVLDLVWPKPDLLIIGTGKGILPLSPKTRQDLSDLGVRVEVQDTRNAAAQFNMLATERGVQNVAAALVPVGRRR